MTRIRSSALGIKQVAAVVLLLMAVVDAVGGLSWALTGSPLPFPQSNRVRPERADRPVPHHARRPPPAVCGTGTGTGSACFPVYRQQLKDGQPVFRYSWSPDCGSPLNMADQNRCLEQERAAWAARVEPHV